MEDFATTRDEQHAAETCHQPPVTSDVVATEKSTVEPQLGVQSPPKQSADFPIETVLHSPTEKNLVFCIDTSASMYNVLDCLKQHISKILHEKANGSTEFRFNLIEFSTKITQWSDRLVKCTPQTVAVANQWLKSLVAKSGTNTMDALLSAFSDPCCDAVYLITDGNPDANSSDILDSVCFAAQNRAVHCYYIKTGTDMDATSYNFLRDLAHATYGSLRVVATTPEGQLGDVSKIYAAEGSGEAIVRTPRGVYFPDTEKYCSLTTSVNSLPSEIPYFVRNMDQYFPFFPSAYHHFYHQHYFPYYGWWRYRSARAWSKFTEQLSADAGLYPIPAAGATLIGRKVLARRHEDGYFYLGSVNSQVYFYLRRR